MEEDSQAIGDRERIGGDGEELGPGVFGWREKGREKVGKESDDFVWDFLFSMLKGRGRERGQRT